MTPFDSISMAPRLNWTQLIPRSPFSSIFGESDSPGPSWDAQKEDVALAQSYGHHTKLKSVLTLTTLPSQVVSQMNPTTGKLYHASVNACLAPMVSVDGKHVITVEVGYVYYPTVATG